MCGGGGFKLNYVLFIFIQIHLLLNLDGAVEVGIVFYFLQCEAWRKYCNQSRGKLDFKGSSGKDYGTHSLN